jgi:NADH:ubiquinone oxidoreductase subunit 3 (subunit A)
MEMILFLDNSLIKKIHNNFNLFNICYYINRIDYHLTQLNKTLNPRKLSAYECGFEPYEDTRHVLTLGFA